MNALRPARITALLCLVMVLVLSGCALSGVRQRSISAREVYREAQNTFTRSKINQYGMTVVSPQLNVGQEAFAQAFVQGLLDSMNETFERYNGDTGLLHPYEAADRINQADLTQDYARMMTLYEKIGILRSKTLQRLRDELGVRYFAVPILINFQDKEYPRVTAFGVRLLNTARATGRFQLQVWDSKTGEIVWEGTSDSTLAWDTFWESPIQFQDIVHETWEALIKKIPEFPEGYLNESANSP